MSQSKANTTSTLEKVPKASTSPAKPMQSSSEGQQQKGEHVEKSKKNASADENVTERGSNKSPQTFSNRTKSQSSSRNDINTDSLPQRRKTPSMSLSEVGDYIKDRRVSESFIEELLDEGKDLREETLCSERVRLH